MTPKEINQLVAEKIMGWTPKPCDLEETGREWTVYDDGYCWCPVCKVSEHISDFEHGIIPPPCYSTDMNAAWQVLRHMVETSYTTKYDTPFHLFAEALMNLEDVGVGTGEEIYPSQSLFRFVVKWNPENICKAALQAIGAI